MVARTSPARHTRDHRLPIMDQALPRHAPRTTRRKLNEPPPVLISHTLVLRRPLVGHDYRHEVRPWFPAAVVLIKFFIFASNINSQILIVVMATAGPVETLAFRHVFPLPSVFDIYPSCLLAVESDEAAQGPRGVNDCMLTPGRRC